MIPQSIQSVNKLQHLLALQPRFNVASEINFNISRMFKEFLKLKLRMRII